MLATVRLTAPKKQIRSTYLAQFLEKLYVNIAVAQRRREVAEIRADNNAVIAIAVVDSAKAF